MSDDVKFALGVAATFVAVAAFIFAVIFAIFGTMLAYEDLFPAHGHSVCLVSHDEEHGGNTFSLCDKRVPR